MDYQALDPNNNLMYNTFNDFKTTMQQNKKSKK